MSTKPRPSNEQLTIALIAGMMMACQNETTPLRQTEPFGAVALAREILATVYLTEEE